MKNSNKAIKLLIQSSNQFNMINKLNLFIMTFLYDIEYIQYD